MLSFDEMIKQDHLNMLTYSEFGEVCLNNRNSQSFNVHKTDAYIEVTAEGLPIVEDKPMFNTSKNFISNGILTPLDIQKYDILTIDSHNYIVREVRNDGIGGIDIYLKDNDNV